MPAKKLTNAFIIEDTPAERTMLTDHLSKYPNVTIKGFFAGEACVKAIVNGTVPEPELILMDYFLDSTLGAKNDGLETLSKIKEILPETEVIMYTSVENKRIIDLAKQKGALDYIVKGAGAFQKLDTIIAEHFAV
jgi:response regulator of citrate/malate metabolism